MTDLPTTAFGRTGHSSSRVIFGAAALGGMTPDRANSVVLPQLLEHGVNHIDTAASYGDSELRVAEWMPDHRDTFFLATKTGERNGPAARAELEKSLERLGVDHVDLIQLHNLVEQDEWETAFSSGGVVEAMEAAQSEGLVRHIGVTGHGLRIAAMHLRSLEEYPFASVLFPWNFSLAQSAAYAADVEALRAVCNERTVAMQTIKSIARRRWPADADGKRFSWYQPIEDPEAIGRAVRWVLGEPDLFLNTSSDARLLDAALTAAHNLDTTPSDAEMAADTDQLDIAPLFDGSALERI